MWPGAGRERRAPAEPRRRSVEVGGWAASATALLTTLAVGLLERALLGGDFSLRFVAETTSRAMPADYRAASLWGGAAGSLLYWCWVLALLTGLADWRLRAAGSPLRAG